MPLVVTYKRIKTVDNSKTFIQKVVTVACESLLFKGGSKLKLFDSQCAKKVVADSLGLVDFAIGLVIARGASEVF